MSFFKMKFTFFILIFSLLIRCQTDKSKQEKMDNFDKISIAATEEFMKVEGVTGVGQGKTKSGKDCILVFVADTTGFSKKIPKKYKGTTVEVQSIGVVDAQLK
jgi:hypothetical protein